MSFVSPLFLVGLLAAAVPILIHLVGRERAPRRRFAALDFVLRSNRRVARRVKLRQLLLLLLRALLVAAVALMMAKPFAEAESELPALGGRQQSAVLIFDDSFSMRRRVAGDLLFDRARARGQQLVTLLGAQADVAVLRTARPTRPLATLTRDTRRVRSAISSLEAGFRHSTVEAALRQAILILHDSSLPERHIFLLTDGAGHAWESGQRPTAPGLQLHVMDLARELEEENHAVVDIASSPSSAPGPRSTAITARICNHRRRAREHKISLTVDGKHVASGALALGAWACGNKIFHHTFPRGGLHNAEVTLEPDDLPEDDRRHLLVEVESPIRVLLVNGAPSPVRHRDELFYLEAALRAGGRRGLPLFSSTVIGGDLKGVRFETFDVVVLVNVSRVPENRAAELERFVGRGGGLLVVTGENVDAAGLNRALGELLPQELRGPLSTAAPGTGDLALRIGRVDTEHPIFLPIWSEGGGAGLRSARFFRVYRLSPKARADRKVLLWYDDGSPALVETRRGQGHVLLFTSTLDRDWNDLPIRPGYLPLVQQMIRYLGRVPNQAPRRSVEVGSVETVQLERGIQRLRLVAPDGAERHWSRGKLAKQPVEIQVRLPGLYALSGAGVDGVLRPLERESFVANLDPRESDLRKARLPAELSAGPASGRAKQRVELWSKVGALILLLLLGEAVLIRRG